MRHTMRRHFNAWRHRLGLGGHAPQDSRHELVGQSQLWQMKRQFQEQFLRDHGLQPEHLFLDLGCGTLRGGIPLIRYLEAGHYYGIEARAHVLEEGRQELKEEGLEVKTPVLIACPDLSKLQLDCRFDMMWAFSVLFHMSDAIMTDALRFARTHLAANGVFYANVNIGTQKTGQWGEFPVMYRSWEAIHEMSEAAGLRVTSLGTLESLGHLSGDAAGDAQLMLAFRCADDEQGADSSLAETEQV